MNDWELLQAYATQRAEAAFRQLVDRYAGMVYQAALRQTASADQAEEVAQIVFIALAQKADRISRRTTLCGWLFRAVRYTVSSQARGNANRQRREQEAFLMQSNVEASEAASVWERVKPHLDEALETLSESDREIILLRFFGNKNHKDVAVTLGISEETARKRLSRSLERLRAIFLQRGIAAPALALMAALPGQSTQAAPPEAASSWAAAALAKAAPRTGANSNGGILSIIAAGKSPVFVACLAGLILLGAGLTVFKLVSHGRTAAPPATGSSTGRAQETSTKAPVTISLARTGARANTVAALDAPLDRVRSALHDPNPTTVYPNAVMQEALSGLGDHKAVAVPLLEEGLKDPQALVRLRAVDGLGLVGPEAGSAAPLLLELLAKGGFREEIPQANYAVEGPPSAIFSNGAVTVQTNRSFPIYTDNIILYALGEIHPASQFLPEFARLLKENKSACAVVYHAIHQFYRSAARPGLMDGGWLWELAGENTQALNDAFGPLMQDGEPLVRRTAACALGRALGGQADPRVFAVASEMLNSSETPRIDIPEALQLLSSAATTPGSTAADIPEKTGTLDSTRLGSYLTEVVAGLTNAAYHAPAEGARLQAAKMLGVLAPDFRQANPALAAGLDQESEASTFLDRVRSREATIPEIIDGMKKYPMAAQQVARFFSFNGTSNDAALLPAFEEELAARAPSPEATPVERTKPLTERMILANAMQKIAPERPKIIFTDSDTIAIRRAWRRDEALQGDLARWPRVSAALDWANWSESRKGLFDTTPDEVRRLLAALKQADAVLYESVSAKVKEIDPHFSESSAP